MRDAGEYPQSQGQSESCRVLSKQSHALTSILSLGWSNEIAYVDMRMNRSQS